MSPVMDTRYKDHHKKSINFSKKRIKTLIVHKFHHWQDGSHKHMCKDEPASTCTHHASKFAHHASKFAHHASITCFHCASTCTQSVRICTHFGSTCTHSACTCIQMPEHLPTMQLYISRSSSTCSHRSSTCTDHAIYVLIFCTQSNASKTLYHAVTSGSF